MGDSLTKEKKELTEEEKVHKKFAVNLFNHTGNLEKEAGEKIAKKEDKDYFKSELEKISI